MFKLCGMAVAVVVLAGGVAAAQTTGQAPATASPATPSPAASSPAVSPPAAAGGQAAVTPATPGVVATTNNPNLAVATLKLQTGQRVSKVIGATVYNEGGEKIGSVDDLIMTADTKISMAVVSVGGFLGLGSKLVAVPWGQVRQDGDKVVLAGASKDSLNGMPGFEY